MEEFIKIDKYAPKIMLSIIIVLRASETGIRSG